MSSVVEGAGGQLPLEPQSTSEILSATHLFTVAIVGRDDVPWGTGPGGMQQRTLRLQVELLELLKGSLDVPPGTRFSLEVVQKRVSAFIEMDYMGLWSHADTAPGVRYLVVSTGASQSPAKLMQEGPCKRLFDAKLAADVHAAIAAEPGTNASRLLQFAYERRAKVDELFGRYLWARIKPAFLKQHAMVLPLIVRLMHAADATEGFRRSVADGLDDAMSDLHEPDDLVIAVARAYFEMLAQPEAQPLHDDLIEGYIFNTVFIDEGKSRIDSHRVFPNAADRQRYASLLKDSDQERAAELRNWLAQR
ncbi:MAG: hypothetical protein LAQ69_46005 [Acidobacteriia bacterium]|nr:hypothetical protein [Terriglobia bacterium]